MKIISWNINGIRAIAKKGLGEWITEVSPDILCLQETKASADQVPKEIAQLSGYYQYFTLGERKGYSGVGVLTKHEPKKVSTVFGLPACDGEGRIIQLDFNDFILLNIYFPNGNASPERLAYKLAFYDAFLAYVTKLYTKGKKVIFCGDVNTAHTEIDLARPKANEHISGFLPEERAWIDQCIAHGFIDTFRMFVTEGEHYTWWDYKTRARERNVGWRLDYFFASANVKKHIRNASILSDVPGSDHCPVCLEIDFSG